MRILKSKNENFEVKNETLRVKKLEYKSTDETFEIKKEHFNI